MAAGFRSFLGFRGWVAGSNPAARPPRPGGGDAFWALRRARMAQAASGRPGEVHCRCAAESPPPGGGGRARVRRPKVKARGSATAPPPGGGGRARVAVRATAGGAACPAAACLGRARVDELAAYDKRAEQQLLIWG